MTVQINHEPFGCIPTTIGDLCLFNFTLKSYKELIKELDKPINEYDAKDFVKKYIRYICFQKSSLREGKYKPDKPLLSVKDISSLTDGDLEAIAKLYIENNEYLFKKEIIKEDKKPDHSIAVSYEYGEVEYPKEENENYIQYFYRLYINYLQRMSKGISEAIISMMPDIKSFSNALGDSIKNTLSWGASLKKTMESIRPTEKGVISQIEAAPMFPKADLLEIERLQEPIRLKPFSEIENRLDQLIDASAQAAEFMIKANEIQTRIAGEIKSSSDGTTKYSKKNVFLTIVVILLTALGIIFTAYTNFQANRNNQINRIEDPENVNLLVENLKKINTSIIDNARLGIENEALKAMVEKQEKTIAEMKILIDRQGNKKRHK